MFVSRANKSRPLHLYLECRGDTNDGERFVDADPHDANLRTWRWVCAPRIDIDGYE